MKYSILFILAFIGSFSISAQNNRFYGSWLGKLETSGIQLRIVLHIEENDGIWVTKLDSPDQLSFGNTAASTNVKGDSIVVTFPLMGIQYDAKISNDSLNGMFQQAGMELPLAMKRTLEPVKAPARPQSNLAPLTYTSKDLLIKTRDEKVKLGATLTLPKGKGPFPAVLLIAGSGPNDRNEEIMGHKSFLVLADYLTRNGIAVLRYDKRGIGKSTGAFNDATTHDFAEDALAAFRYLEKQKKIDVSKVGIIGHSEGGLIAPIVATEEKGVDFIILMAGPSVSGAKILPDQTDLILTINGTEPKDVANNVKLVELVTDYINKNASNPRLEKDLSLEIEKFVMATNFNYPSSMSRSSFAVQTAQTYTKKWMKNFILLDPQTYIESLTIPVLAIFGEKDLQVSPRLNEKPMEKLLDGKKGSKVVTLSNMNHLFQSASTGSPTEYPLIEETLSPIFMEIVKDWIKSVK